MRAKIHKVFHRDFLGAHRYTTASGGIVRPAGGVLRTAVVCLRQPRGDDPLRCLRTYPNIAIALKQGREPRPSFMIELALSQYYNHRLHELSKVRCCHGC